LELRKNSPQGEKVAYLPASSVQNMLYTQTTASMTLFPVYVFYNKTTQEVNTLYTDDLKQTITVSPRSAADPTKIITYVFPYNDEDAWNKIVKKLKSPVAYIRVINQMDNQSVYFTTAGSRWLYSQEGYDAVAPGEDLLFEVKASDYDEDTKNGGQRMNLVITYFGGIEEIYVRDEKDEENVLPLIKNGYNYEINIVPDLKSEDSKYKAIINEVSKRDLSELIDIQ